MSIFDIAHMTDLGSKTGNRTLTSLKMFLKLLIHQLAFRSPCYTDVTCNSGRRPIIEFSMFTAVYLFLYMKQSDKVNFYDMCCTWKAGHVIGMIS